MDGLAEGDLDGALERSLELLAVERERWPAKEAAAQVWWIAEVFGPEAAGGTDEVASARLLLEETHSEQALREPELFRGR